LEEHGKRLRIPTTRQVMTRGGYPRVPEDPKPGAPATNDNTESPS
jgi:hypothetical protein